MLVLGQSVISHSMYSCIERLARHIGNITGASIVTLPPANSVAGWIAGCLPHRTVNGKEVGQAGMSARQMIYNPRSAYLLFNIEPSKDMADGLHASDAMDSASYVVSFQSFTDVPDYVDAVLPIAPYTENAGTFINCEGRIQNSVAAVAPYQEARPGWKIIRVLGNLLGVSGFDYTAIDEIVDEASPMSGICAPQVDINAAIVPCVEKQNVRELGRFELISDPLIYAIDPVVRRSEPLQKTADASPSHIGLHPTDMALLELDSGAPVTIRHDLYTIHSHAMPDARVALGCAYFPAGMNVGPTAACGAEIRLEREEVE